MDKKPYETPQLQALGAVQDLTRQDLEKCHGSADALFPREPQGGGDFACVIDR